MGKFLSESGLKTLWNRITTSFLTSGATNATSATIDTLASKIPSTETIDESTSYIPVITKQGNNGSNSVTASTIPYSKVTENTIKGVNIDEKPLSPNNGVVTIETVTEKELTRTYLQEGISGTQFDAARHILGGDWRIPTETEVRELYSNCEWTLFNKDNLEFNGVAGYKVTSKIEGYTDNFIFFPLGYCWASNPVKSVSSIAWGMCFYDYAKDFRDIWERRQGFSIRAVSNVEGVDLGLSVRWSNCNIGATTISEKGDTFAFGELTPKATYTWDNYMCKKEECGTLKDPLAMEITDLGENEKLLSGTGLNLVRKRIYEMIGSLGLLNTTAKTNLVDAVNEVLRGVPTEITIDTELNESSTNAIANNAVAEALSNLQSGKQDKLIEGANIVIGEDGKTISAVSAGFKVEETDDAFILKGEAPSDSQYYSKTEIDKKFEEFDAGCGEVSWNDITDKPTIPTVDTALDVDSANAITNKAVANKIAELPKTVNKVAPDENGNIDVPRITDDELQKTYLNMCISGTKYDAARHILGGDWRIPTKEEWQELIDFAISNTRDNQPAGTENRVQTLTFPNGKQLLFIHNEFITANGEPSNPKRAYVVHHADSGSGVGTNYFRYLQSQIRPVTNNPTLGIDLGLPSGLRWADRDLASTGFVDSIYERGHFFAFAELAPKASYTWESYMCTLAECGTSADPLMEWYEGDMEETDHYLNTRGLNIVRKQISDKMNAEVSSAVKALGVKNVRWADASKEELIIELNS